MYIEFTEIPDDRLPMVATIHAEGKHFHTVEHAALSVADAFPDFIEFLNEGAPICLGNGYAWYEFTAIVNGHQYTFGFGPDDMAHLNHGECKLYAAPFNEFTE